MNLLRLRPEYVTVLLFLIALAISSALSPYFADLVFILESATYSIELGLIALTLTLVVISGEIDLSVAAILALSACIFGEVFDAGGGVWPATLAALLAGLAMGLGNGLLVTRLGLPSLIVTIGTMTLYRGIAQVLVGDKSIGGFPGWFVGIDFRTLGIVPVPVALFFAVAAVLAFVLAGTVFGRQVYLIGTNLTAARFAGVRVERVKLILFALSGLTAAAGGVLMASRLGVVRYDMATAGELRAVLIVMLGGTYIFGGRGSIFGTVVALWLLIVIQTGMTVANIKIESQLTVLGLLLILAIVGSNAIYARTGR